MKGNKVQFYIGTNRQTTVVPSGFERFFSGIRFDTYSQFKKAKDMMIECVELFESGILFKDSNKIKKSNDIKTELESYIIEVDPMRYYGYVGEYPIEMDIEDYVY